MDKIRKLEGSVSQDDFILGLLQARGVETLGDIWEKHIDCNHCKFAKQCKAIGDAFADQDKNPACGQIVDLLLGDIKVEDIK
jgi:hypothetical protein